MHDKHHPRLGAPSAPKVHRQIADTHFSIDCWVQPHLGSQSSIYTSDQNWEMFARQVIAKINQHTSDILLFEVLPVALAPSRQGRLARWLCDT